MFSAHLTKNSLLTIQIEICCYVNLSHLHNSSETKSAEWGNKGQQQKRSTVFKLQGQ